MELREYLQKNDMVIYYLGGNAKIVVGFPHKEISKHKELSDIVPFDMPKNMEFKFGSDHDYCSVNNRFKSIIYSDEGFYEFIDRINYGVA